MKIPFEDIREIVNHYYPEELDNFQEWLEDQGIKVPENEDELFNLIANNHDHICGALERVNRWLERNNK